MSSMSKNIQDYQYNILKHEDSWVSWSSKLSELQMKRLFGYHYVLVLLLSNCHFTSKILNLIFQLHYEEIFSDNLTKVIVNRVIIHLAMI